MYVPSRRMFRIIHWHQHSTHLTTKSYKALSVSSFTCPLIRPLTFGSQKNFQVPLLHQGAVYDYIQLKEPNFFDSQSANVMFKLHVLLLTQCIPSPIENSNSSDCAEAPVSASSRMHAQIADIQLRYVIGTYRVWGDWILLKTLAIQISAISLPRSAYSTSLISTLKVVLDKAIDLRNHIDTALTYISELPIRREITNSVAPWFIELAPHVLDYLRVGFN